MQQQNSPQIQQQSSNQSLKGEQFGKRDDNKCSKHTDLEKQIICIDSNCKEKNKFGCAKCVIIQEGIHYHHQVIYINEANQYLLINKEESIDEQTLQNEKKQQQMVDFVNQTFEQITCNMQHNYNKIKENLIKLIKEQSEGRIQLSDYEFLQNITSITQINSEAELQQIVSILQSQYYQQKLTLEQRDQQLRNILNRVQEVIKQQQIEQIEYIVNEFDLSLNQEFKGGISKILLPNNYPTFKKWFEGKDIKLALIYRATEHGFDATSFHKHCDNKGPTLVVIKSQSGNVFGGYADSSWDSSDDIEKTNKQCFLFSITLNRKFPQKITDGQSIYCNPSYGPIFGGKYYPQFSDLYICSDSDIKAESYSAIGKFYDNLGININIIGTDNNKLIQEIEVFTVTY